ncbi:MAG: AAA family ATPase, partial [Myxococcales bacterium]|nr:AAA family ATPase [Myxococcales bacterium]
DRYPTARAMAAELGRYLHRQEHVFDATVLERFIAEVAPRKITDTDGEPAREATMPTVSGRLEGPPVQRDRRPVVVIAGTLRKSTDRAGDDAGPALDEGAVHVFEDMAFKSDAVLRWLGADRSRFQFILGLRRASIQDPLTAMRVAVDALEALSGLSEDGTRELKASMSVSRGIVATTRDGEGRLLGFEPVGGALALSEELANAGAPGEILVTGCVYRMVRRVFAFDHEGSREIDLSAQVGGEGRRALVHCLRGALTRAERSAGAWRGIDAQVLFGRDDELKTIRDAYDHAAQTEQSRFVAVVGELGVGKTVVVAKALQKLVPAPRILHAECAFGSTDLPYATLSELLRDAARVGDRASPEEALELFDDFVHDTVRPRGRAESVVEVLRPLLLAQAPSPAEVSDHSRVVLGAVRLLLRAMGEAGPLVLWVDAVQWADGPTLDLMADLLRRRYDLPLLVLLSTRKEARVARVLRDVEVVPLGDLDPPDAKSLVQHLLEGAVVGPDVEQAILDRAGGNPFFVHELVESLFEKGILRPPAQGDGRPARRLSQLPMALPKTLEGVIAARLDDVTQEERYAVRWLAVLGPGFASEELHEISGTDLSSSLAALEQRGVVERVSGGAWRFPSAVFRHVAYETTDRADRVRMHRRAGAYLERQRPP